MMSLKKSFGITGGILGIITSIMNFLFIDNFTISFIGIFASIIAIVFSCFYDKQPKICGIILIICSLPLLYTLQYFTATAAAFMVASALIIIKNEKVMY